MRGSRGTAQQEEFTAIQPRELTPDDIATLAMCDTMEQVWEDEYYEAIKSQKMRAHGSKASRLKRTSWDEVIADRQAAQQLAEKAARRGGSGSADRNDPSLRKALAEHRRSVLIHRAEHAHEDAHNAAIGAPLRWKDELGEF